MAELPGDDVVPDKTEQLHPEREIDAEESGKCWLDYLARLTKFEEELLHGQDRCLRIIEAHVPVASPEFNHGIASGYKIFRGSFRVKLSNGAFVTIK